MRLSVAARRLDGALCFIGPAIWYPQESGPEGQKGYPSWEVCWTLLTQRFSALVRSANARGAGLNSWP
jgi:hypothetical protein